MSSQRDTAISLMHQQKFADALPLFLRLVEGTPEDWSLFYMLGQCYRFINNIPDAVRSLEKSADLNQNEPQVYLALGISYQLSEDYSSAINSFENAIRLDPRLVSAHNSIGLTYMKTGEFHKALEWYSRAAEVIVSLVTDEVHKNRKKCFSEEIVEGKKTLVVLPYVLEKTHDLLCSDPTYAIITNSMGVCLIELDEIEEAKTQFRESIKFIPDGYNYPDPYKNLESIG